MNTSNVRAHIVLTLLRQKHTLGGVGVAAGALIAVRGTEDPATELALILDTALDLLDASISSTGLFDEHLEALRTELNFKEITEQLETDPDEDRRC